MKTLTSKKTNRHLDTLKLLSILLLLTVLLVQVAEANATPIELAYDNGTASGGGFTFAGVRFSLPAGVTSAHLLTVRFAWSSFPDALNIHITHADHTTEFPGSPVAATSTAAATYSADVDVSGLGIVVSGDFFIVLEHTTVGNAQFDGGVSTGRSYGDASLATITLIPSGDGNLLIRAVIDPIPATTTTTATTFAPVHQTPVGGVMLPSVGFTVLVPWVIVLSLLGVVSVESLHVKRRDKRR